MKKLFTLIFLVSSLFAIAQAPKFINYQGIARDALGNPITNTTIGLKFLIATSTNPVFHSETQLSVAVNALGLFNTKIGISPPLPLTGWEDTPAILTVAISISGGAFISLGSQNLASVPFALYAESAPIPTLQLNGNNLSLIGGNTITLPGGTVAIVPNTSVTGSGIASITAIGTNSFDIFVPAVNISGAGNTTVSGSFPNYTITGAGGISPTITGAGASTVTSAGNSFTVNTPQVNINTAGGATVSGVFPNYTISAPTNSLSGDVTGTFLSNTVTALRGFALANVAPALGQILAYTGAVWTPTTPPLVPLAAWIKSGITVTLATNTDFVGIGTATPAEKLQVESAGPTRLSVISSNTSALWFGTTVLHNKGFLHYDNVSNELNFGTNNTASRMRVFGNGDVAFGSTVTPNPVNSFANFCKQGANDTKVVISGGDNSNTYGGMLAFGENETSTQGFTIRLNAGANRLMFTNDPNGLNPVMVLGGYSGANVGLTIGPGFSGSQPPANGLLVQGNVGIGTTTPVNTLHVNGGVTITDGSQGLGKVFTSDASGNGSWQPVTTIATFAFSTQFLASVTTSPILLATLASYTKVFSDTKIEVILQTHLGVDDLVGANSLKYELRINGAPAPGNTGRTNYFIDNNNVMPISAYNPTMLIADFAGIPAGLCSIQIWVYTPGGSASGAYLDPGNYGASGIIVKEYR